MDYRITLTIARHGASEDAAEAALDSLLELYPECGPVVTQNTETGALALTIAVEATDPWAAGDLAGKIFAKSLDHAKLEVVPILDVSTTAIDPEHAQSDSWDLVRV